MTKFFTFLLSCFSLTVFAQTPTISMIGGSCYPSGTTLTENGSTNIGGITRKTFTGNAGSASIQVIYTSTDGGRWEIQWLSPSPFSVDYYSAVRSSPLAPNFTLGAWVNNSGGGCANLSKFEGTGTQATLPVELTAFDAQNTKGSNRLVWATASEKNNQGFDIERSADGVRFEKIGFVKGNGTTQQPQQYTYTDDAVGSVVTYYRLKQVDTDGKYEYSKIVSVEGKGDGLKVYPTGVWDGILTVQSEPLQDFTVTNLFGQTVMVGKTTQQLDVSALAKGTYLLKVGSEGAKFVKQ